MLNLLIFRVIFYILPNARVSVTPHCHPWPRGRGGGIYGFSTTFGWLHDVLLIHVHGVVILLAKLIQYSQNHSEEWLLAL